MARDIRLFRKGAVYHVTNQTYRGELRLTPSEIVEIFVEGCLGKAVRMYGVRVFVHVVMGNHFHLLVQAPWGNLHAFMLYFQRELSRRLNLYRGVTNTNFPRRYKAQEIASPRDFVELAGRILCNPVRSRLVYEAADWPGVSSLQMHREAETQRTVRHATRAQAAAMRNNGLTPEIERSLQQLDIKLSTPPFWRDLSEQDVQSRIADAADAEEARLQEEIDRGRERTRGRNRILAETHRKRPEVVCWRGHRRCVSRDAEFEAEFNAWYDEATRKYKRAATKWRLGKKWGDYPPGSFPPGWLRCLPRSSEVGPRLPWHEPRPMAA